MLLNKKSKGTYSISEKIQFENGRFEGILKHDNVIENTIMILDSNNNFIEDYVISHPENKEWETHITVYSNSTDAVIYYETQGDTVDADDINYLQEQINEVGNIDDKVDKVPGKDLSTNDFTDNYKLKLESVEHGANRTTKVSELLNDEGYLKSVNWGMITNKPYQFKPEPHTHKMDNISGLEATLLSLENKIQNAGSVNSVNDKKGDVVLYGTDINVGGSLGDNVNLFDIAISHIDSLEDIKGKADKDNVVNSINGEVGDVTLYLDNMNFTSGMSMSDVFEEIAQTLAVAMDLKADKSEVDNLKQSGVESNKILVDNLNSKGVEASTSDSIRTNVSKVELIPTGTHVDDTTGSPGSLNLLKGTMNEGFFGTLPASIIFTGRELSSALGFSAGTLIHDDTIWLKFAWKGKILFRPLKPIRGNTSWQDIDRANLVYGNRTVTKNGIRYKVRLMKGATVDPADPSLSDKGAKGSEWNRLILPLHEEVKDGSWGYSSNVEDDIPDWGYYFTNDDFHIQREGRYIWCQEATSGGEKLTKGWAGVTFSGSSPIDHKFMRSGWCPILEVV